VLLLLPSGFAQVEDGCAASCLCGCQASVDFGQSDVYGQQLRRGCCCKMDKVPASNNNEPSPHRHFESSQSQLGPIFFAEISDPYLPPTAKSTFLKLFPARAPPDLLHLRYCVFLC